MPQIIKTEMKADGNIIAALNFIIVRPYLFKITLEEIMKKFPNNLFRCLPFTVIFAILLPF